MLKTGAESLSPWELLHVRGSYTFPEECIIDGISNVTIEGSNAHSTVADGVNPANAIRVVNSSGFAIRGLGLDGNKQNNTSGSGYGIFVRDSCSDYDIGNVTVRDTYTHSILCGSNGWSVRNSRVYDFGTASNSADGIISTNPAVSQATIEGNYIKNEADLPGAPYAIEL